MIPHHSMADVEVFMKKVNKTDQEWREQLSEESYRVTREAGTERPFTGQYWDLEDNGKYHCVCCGELLFVSDSKFDAGCGWPSFDKPSEAAPIEERKDTSHGMVRTEVVCSNCDAHLGHVFTDGPTDTGLRYCINTAPLSSEADNGDDK